MIQTQTGAENIIWDLSPLYSGVDDPAIDDDMHKLLALVDDFAARYRGQVGTLDGEQLAAAMQAMEAIYDLSGRLEGFANLVYATDTGDPQHGALIQKMTEFGSLVSQKLIFFELEWNQADDGHVEEVLAHPALVQYRHHLEAQRRYTPYQLDEGREQLLIEKGVTGKHAWARFFSQLTSAMRYDLDGEEKTQTEVLSELHLADRERRRMAADAMTAGLRGKTMELTYIFNTMVAEKATDDRLRGYPTWITSRNLANKAPDSVVDALVEAVTARYDLCARHYNLKRGLLGVDELYDYDRYAPLPVQESDRIYPWEDARQIVLNAFESFHPRMAQTAARFFDENWIHAALAPNKRSGAFASPVVPSVHPYVFLNYTGRARDVSTLAHELGHGIHMKLSGDESGLFALYTPLTTAEMASVFAEMLVFSDLMAKEPDKAVQLGMLMEKVEDSFATVFRQTAMNRFEEKLHTERREKGELTTGRISELWLETQNDQFQGSVTLREDYGLWWSYIPHFIHVPGYVYAYAFGELLVLALYELYREQGAPFAEQYIDVLAAGDSDYPDRILARVGVDLNDPAFWHKGLDVLERLIDQEEVLAREVFPEKF